MAPGANQTPLGNILIIQEDATSCTPNDNGNGGTITFEFVDSLDQPVEVTLQFFELLDIEGSEANAGVDFEYFNDLGQSLGSQGSAGPGDNGYEQFVLNEEGVAKVVTTLSGSGSIPSIVVSIGDPSAGLGNYVCDLLLHRRREH